MCLLSAVNKGVKKMIWAQGDSLEIGRNALFRHPSMKLKDFGRLPSIPSFVQAFRQSRCVLVVSTKIAICEARLLGKESEFQDAHILTI